ncbi:MAG: DUF167 domain-containing protein [Rhizobium sp.]|nr:DUF167 domain-containing protein [Rhizobium sp.]
MILAKVPQPPQARLSVRLTPNGGRDAIDACEMDTENGPLLRARVSAAPEGGKANAALIALIAKSLKIPKTSIGIDSGATSRTKNLRIAVAPEVLSEKLALLKLT